VQFPMFRMMLIAGATTVLLAGCGKSDDDGPASAAPEATGSETATPAPSPEPPPAGPGQSMTQEGATVSVGAAAARVATPAYAPLYPGAVVSSSVIGESGVGPGGSVSYRANASPAAVIAFYEDRLKSISKPISMKQDMGGDVHMLTAGDSGDGKGAVQIIASPAGKGAEVQLTWSDE
jgi:hypothetical protein